MSEYFVFVKDDNTGEETLEEVEVKVYPFEYQSISLFAFRKDCTSEWNVTEKSTGRRLTYGRTKNEAQQEAINVINKEGIEKVKEIIKYNLSKIKIEKTPEESEWEDSLA